MLGSHRYFEDREAEMVWIPEQAYKEGSWGYVGGEAYRRATNFGTLLGTDLDIWDPKRPYIPNTTHRY